ncbi:SelB C-terminal domain-containing protein [Helicobacter winghamensis]
MIKKEGYLDINNFKTHLNLSRKYLITYLDYLDSFNDIENDNGRRIFK